MNRINEIGDTVKGQEMLGRAAERAFQRGLNASGNEREKYWDTQYDLYQTAAGNSRKHLDGSGAHYQRGRNAEYDKNWDDGRYTWSKKHKTNNESKNMNKKLIRLTESDLHKIVKESVDRILNEKTLEDWQEKYLSQNSSPLCDFVVNKGNKDIHYVGLPKTKYTQNDFNVLSNDWDALTNAFKKNRDIWYITNEELFSNLSNDVFPHDRFYWIALTKNGQMFKIG